MREKREDIPFLVDHFIRKFNAKTGKKIISVSPNVMSILMRYDFPGNIRELENIIEHGFVLCRSSIIKREHLPPELLQSESDFDKSKKLESTPVTESIDEQASIITTIRNCGGIISKAAEELGMHRSTLWRKIKRYRIDINEL